MEVLILSNNDNVKQLYDRLEEKKNHVMIFSDLITIEDIDKLKPEMVVSYNYRHIVSEDVINRMGDAIINLHTSYLPWNRGASPNIWSFIDDTPKGVTIHRLEKGLDTGKIIVQKEVFFNEEKDTLSSTYSKLNREIVQLLIDNWEIISSRKYTLKNQVGKGSYHKATDLIKLLKGRTIDYSMTISKFKKYIICCGEE